MNLRAMETNRLDEPLLYCMSFEFSDAVIIDEVHHLANHFVLIHLTDLEIGTDVYVPDNLNVR